MSATVVIAPSPAPHDRSSYIDIAHPPPSAHVKPTKMMRSNPPAANYTGSRTDSKSPKSTPKSTSSKASPIISRHIATSQVVVKKEPPSSPDLRHRPRKLDLAGNSPRASSNQSNDATNPFHPATARPIAGQLTGRMDGLGIQEVGLACLSPGFNTQDPTMRDHLQRSISVREQQKTLIEARMNKQFARSDNSTTTDTPKEHDVAGTFVSKAPGTSKRKPPPSLSIVTPSHEEFAQERIIQSAPLNQTFTMGRYQPQPLTRHFMNHPSNLSNTSHIHHVSSNNSQTGSSIQHVPAIQSSNRLPPIMDIFTAEHLAPHETSKPRSSAKNTTSSASNSSHSNSRPPFPSPSKPTAQQLPSGRPREYRSAEDAQVDLSGGRPELLPRLIHYGGHQPPTPPSPRATKVARQGDLNRSGGEKKRARAEYEDEETPSLGYASSSHRRSGPLDDGRESPLSSQRKKEHFIRLCAEAWDLFHS